MVNIEEGGAVDDAGTDLPEMAGVSCMASMPGTYLLESLTAVA